MTSTLDPFAVISLCIGDSPICEIDVAMSVAVKYFAPFQTKKDCCSAAVPQQRAGRTGL